MDVSVKLKSRDHVELFANGIRERQEQLKSQIADAEKELGDLNLLLQQLYPPQLATEIEIVSENGYDKDWSIRQKAQYILVKAKRAMTTAEIANTIIEYEKGADRKAVVRNLSVVFASSNKFDKEKNQKGENIYNIAGV
jgi:hypothetical protein